MFTEKVKKRFQNSRIIAVSGGKGGTGKSTVATTLAYELSKQYKVLLVDADVDCPNDHLLLNIERKLLEEVKQRIPVWDNEKCDSHGICSTVCKSNAIVAIKGKNPIFVPTQCNGCGSCVLGCPNQAISWGEKEIGWVYQGKREGIDLLSGELKTNESVSEFIVNALNKIIDKKKADYDYIIVDTAAGTHCPVIAVFEVCDTVLAVTEPTPLGKHDLELILQLANKIKIKTDIILNRADIGDRQLIENLAEKYLKKIIFEIPYSKRIAEQYAKGELFEIEGIDKII